MSDENDQYVEKARKLGADAGKTAASWVLDGNTTADTYRTVLKGIDEGDPAVMDAYNPPNMSGEYSGYGEDELAGDLDLLTMDEMADAGASDTESTEQADLLGECANAYNDASSEAFWHEIERICREHVKPHGLDTEATYTVAGSRVAWHITSDTAVDDKVPAVMVGDDRQEDVDLSDLTIIADEDYCPECGGIPSCYPAE